MLHSQLEKSSVEKDFGPAQPDFFPSSAIPPRLGVDGMSPAAEKSARRYLVSASYAYSIKTTRVKEADFPYHGRQLSCTSELAHFARSLTDLDTERMCIVYLDAQNQMLGIQTMQGTANQAVVYPREVIRHALLLSASAMILIHNHPSGNIKPSDADIRLTKTIRESARMFDILVHDHIIVGEYPAFFSMREEGLMS